MGRPVGLTAWYAAERDAEFIACDRAGLSTKQLSERFKVSERTDDGA